MGIPAKKSGAEGADVFWRDQGFELNRPTLNAERPIQKIIER
jgi:hypothetical protein